MNYFWRNKGITLIALIVTIVLNCWRSGRKKIRNTIKYNKLIIKMPKTLANAANLL